MAIAAAAQAGMTAPFLFASAVTGKQTVKNRLEPKAFIVGFIAAAPGLTTRQVRLSSLLCSQRQIKGSKGLP
ncbi:MAG: hypothetical protein ACREC6_15220, partial [Hyphomicrobiaceae bacterium]